MELIPHRRQFVIDRERHAFDEDWRSVDLPDGFVLSHHAELKVAPAANGTLLLGAAYPGAGRDGLAGRFVKLGWPHAETDSSALLSVHYLAGVDGPLVSSSPALLARLAPPSGPQPQREMRWGGLNWVPGPGSRLTGARKLLPGQRLRIPDLAVDDSSDGLRPIGSVEAARAVVAEELTATVRQAAANADTTYLALTAGLDSRTLLGALLAAGVRFEVITQVVHNPMDVRVASRICRYLGVRHHVVEPQPRDEARWKVWNEHAFGSYCDADDNLLIPHNQYRFLGRDDILIRGGCFEIGRRFMVPTLHGLTFENATGEIIWRRFEGDSPADADTVRSLDEWLAMRRDRRDGLDLIDGFYNDQRVGGWLAAVEQGLDLLPGASVQPANSDRVKEALLAPAPEERTAGSLQRAVVQDLEPRLARFPVNPKGIRHYAGAVRRRAKGAVRLLQRRLGGAREGAPDT